MGVATAFTAARSKEIEDSTVVAGFVDIDGNLLLERRDGGTINAGHVVGPAAPNLADASETIKGIAELSSNTEALAGINNTTIMTPLRVKETQNSITSKVSDLERVSSFTAIGTTQATKSGASTYTKVPMPTVRSQRGSNYNTTLSRYTAPYDGIYEINAAFVQSTNTTGPVIQIYKNGVIHTGPPEFLIGYTTAYHTFSKTEMLDLVADDYIELFWTNTNLTTVTLDYTRCSWSMKFISP